MLRLYDSRTGATAPVVPARRGEFRTYLMGPPAAELIASLRSCLLADLVRRVAEGHGLAVVAWQDVSPGENGSGLAQACGALNMYPAEYVRQSPGEFDLGVAAGAGSTGQGARWIRAAGARPDPAAAAGAPLTPAGLSGRGMDPLALRLVLLRQHYRHPVTAGWDALTAADADLRRWRGLLAGWANQPSRPMSDRHLREAAGAFDDDLDIPAALRTLDALAADGEVPPGSKFETLAHLDRVLALDLAREVGRL